MKFASQAAIALRTFGCRRASKFVVENASEPDTGKYPEPASPLRRAVFAALGVLFAGIAGVGVFLPGIPTVGPLIVASIFLTKSNPALERKLIRNKFFARYLPYLDGTTEMSPAAKRSSIALMWLSICVSCSLLYLSGQGYWWLLGTIVLAGLVGTVFIHNFGKQRKPKL